MFGVSLVKTQPLQTITRVPGLPVTSPSTQHCRNHSTQTRCRMTAGCLNLIPRPLLPTLPSAFPYSPPPPFLLLSLTLPLFPSTLHFPSLFSLLLPPSLPPPPPHSGGKDRPVMVHLSKWWLGELISVAQPKTSAMALFRQEKAMMCDIAYTLALNSRTMTSILMHHSALVCGILRNFWGLISAHVICHVTGNTSHMTSHELC